MTFVERAERAVAALLPPAATKWLQDFKQRLPLHFIQAAPVVQMFINDSRTRSFVGLHNFYSCLLADLETPAVIELRFYGPDGHLVLAHGLSLPHFAARAVDVRALFEAKQITAPYGVVTAQVTPRAPRRRAYRDLGLVSSHFFVFFRDAETGSVEQTHPLSTTDSANAPSEPFCSSQVISTAKLRQLVAFQYNPSTRTHTLEHSLVDLQTGDIVARSTCKVPAMGSARSVFTFGELAAVPEHLLFCVDALPSSNAKPMLRRVFDGGRHSMSHA